MAKTILFRSAPFAAKYGDCTRDESLDFSKEAGEGGDILAFPKDAGEGGDILAFSKEAGEGEDILAFSKDAGEGGDILGAAVVLRTLDGEEEGWSLAGNRDSGGLVVFWELLPGTSVSSSSARVDKQRHLLGDELNLHI